jgi:parvulin-like peptidyl-prolyl isomerase
MATLENIRRRSGLLIIVIGFAMLAFILTDLFSSGDSLLRGDANVVGRVESRTLEYQEFTERIDERLELLRQQNPQQAANFSRVMVAEQIWNEFLQETILKNSYEELGLAITDAEFVKLISENPQLRDQPQFKDQVTGKFSFAAFSNYLEQVKEQAAENPQAQQTYQQFIQFEESIVEQGLRQKYEAAIKKGIYMPQSLAKSIYERRQSASVTNFLGLEYSSLQDSTVQVSESELKKYYQNHKRDFDRKALRDIAFVNFNVEASKKDEKNIKDELMAYLEPEVIKIRGRVDTLPSFSEAENDSIFAVGRSDAPVQARFLTKEQLPAPLDSILMNKDTGYIHGPYEDVNAFSLSKISAIGTIPDSVKARHILISFQGANQGQSQSQRPPQEAQALADSLFTKFKEDTLGFASAAKELSDDPGSGSKGGDLGWFERNAMVQPFAKFTFTNKTGDVGLVFSQFGFHIIHIQDQAGSNKALKLVTIRRTIEPSEATRDSIYEAASLFASEASKSADFGATAAEMGYSPRPATDITPLQEQIIGLGQNRKVVQWAFNEETKVGEIDLFNNNNAYLVVTLTKASEKGIAPFEDVVEEVKEAVIKEKKATALAERIEKANASDLNTLAQSLGTSLKNQNITFASGNLTDFGSEPKVIGTITAMPINTLSAPLRGDRGVYVAKVVNRNPGEALSSYESEQVRLATEIQNLASSQLLESLKETAKVEDNRAKFL